MAKREKIDKGKFVFGILLVLIGVGVEYSTHIFITHPEDSIFRIVGIIMGIVLIAAGIIIGIKSIYRGRIADFDINDLPHDEAGFSDGDDENKKNNLETSKKKEPDDIKEIIIRQPKYKLVMLILDILLIASGIIVYLSNPFIPQGFLSSFFVLSFIVFCLWSFMVFNVVREDQMGIKVFLGQPGDEVDSGLHTIWWPFEKLVRFPTKLQIIEFATNTVMSKRGRVEGYQDIIESAEINVLFTLFFFFTKGRLKQTVIKAPGSSLKDIASAVLPYVKSVNRTLIGRIPWRLINEERFKYTQLALSRLVPLDPETEKCYELNKDATKKGKEKGVVSYSFTESNACLTKKNLQKSPFVELELDQVSLAIEDVDFTDPKLQEAVSKPETARLEKAAVQLTAEGERYKRQQEGIGSAEARNAMLKVIKDSPDMETLYKLSEMAQGTSNTILFQMPRVFEDKVSNLLGGNRPGDFSKLLKPEDQKFLVELINEGIRKLSEKSGGK